MRECPDGAADRRLFRVLGSAASGGGGRANHPRARCAGCRRGNRSAPGGARARDCARPARADRFAAVRQFRGGRLRRAPRRSRWQSRDQAPGGRARDRGPGRRAPSAGGCGNPHLHRRADAGRRRHRLHAGRRAPGRRCGGRAGRARERLAHAIAAAASEHDLVITSGGVSTGEADHVRHAVETIGRLVFWRVAIKPGRPVAMGVIPGVAGGAAFVGLPGNPAAVYVTFARIVRPLLLRLAGAEAAPLLPLPVRSAFAYRKRAGRREYVRVKLARAADGTVEAIKHAQEGAGVITSLTETDGLVELLEDITTVAPRATLGFRCYAAPVA